MAGSTPTPPAEPARLVTIRSETSTASLNRGTGGLTRLNWILGQDLPHLDNVPRGFYLNMGFYPDNRAHP